MSDEKEWLKEVLEEASADVQKWPDWLKDSRNDRDTGVQAAPTSGSSAHGRGNEGGGHEANRARIRIAEVEDAVDNLRGAVSEG